MKSIHVLKSIYEINQKQKDYNSTLPQEISTFIVTNQYSELNHEQIDLLLKNLFQEEYESIAWFLYDWRPGFTIIENETEFAIKTESDFYCYLLNHCGWKA